MNVPLAMAGVFCAAATPVHPDLSPHFELFTAHCQQLLSAGCDGIALLGTTGEANCFGMSERMALLEHVVAAGIAPDRLMPGTGCCAVPDTVELTRHALSLGVHRVVMLPPYYYKNASDDGLFAAYAETIQRIGDSRLKIVLYHIPQMSAVAITHGLIERLLEAFPDTVVGIKDSAGNFDNMRSMVESFPGLAVFAGADPLLLPLREIGGAGCITATANIVAAELATIFAGALDPSRKTAVAAAQAKIVAYRNLSNGYGAQIPTIKAMLAHLSGNPDWAIVRPPLTLLERSKYADLQVAMAALDRP